jgi:hypothetical protein
MHPDVLPPVMLPPREVPSASPLQPSLHAKDHDLMQPLACGVEASLQVGVQWCGSLTAAGKRRLGIVLSEPPTRTAPAEVAHKIGGRLWSPIQIPLRLVALLVPQKSSLGVGLHPFGDEAEAETLGHAEQRADDGRRLRIVGYALDEGAINLDPRHREQRQIAKRREAGAEIVEGEFLSLLP